MKKFVLLLVVCLLALPRPAVAQQAAAPAADLDAPVLSLDEAVALALGHNRLVKDAELDAQKHAVRVKIARTRRLPQFQVAVLAGNLLRPIDFTFPAGAFGTYPETGPIPSTDAKIRTPARLTTFMTGSIDVPLLQQYKIGLGIRATELAGDVAQESVRRERQRIAAQVRTAYLALVATQAAVDAAREGVRTLEEAQRVTAQHAAQETVLRAEALEVEARLARSRYELATAENGMATHREQLNQLLGRDLTTAFRVQPHADAESREVTLDVARQRALESRPEIRSARLKEQQAELDRRLAKAEYIPDLSLSVRHLGFQNVQVVPSNVATAGLFLSWEPFDWGRRSHTVAEKTRTLEQARNGSQETVSKVALEVGQIHRSWQEAALLLRATYTAHHAALEQLRVTTNRYQAESALLRDLLQAQARSSEAAREYQQALSAYWGALAELRRAMGDE